MKLIEALRACKTEEDYAKVIAVVQRDAVDGYISTNLAYYESVEKNEGTRKHFQKEYDEMEEPNFGMAMVKLNMKYREPNNWDEIIKRTKGDFEAFKKMFIDKDENGKTRAGRIWEREEVKTKQAKAEKSFLDKIKMHEECESDKKRHICPECGNENCEEADFGFLSDTSLFYEFHCQKCGQKFKVTYYKMDGEQKYMGKLELVEKNDKQ